MQPLQVSRAPTQRTPMGQCSTVQEWPPCSRKSGTPAFTFRLQCGSRPRPCSHDQGAHDPCHSDRKSVGPGVSPPRHERGRGCQRWQTHRGLGARPSLLWRCTACSGHHTPLCLDTRGGTAPQRGRCGRRCAGQCQERQGSQVPRAGCFPSLQTHRRRDRDRWRWSEEAVDFVRQLSIAKAEEVPSFMRRSVSLFWERRWTRMLSVVCATAFAASLVEPARQCESICWTGGDAPPLADLLWQDPRG